jgi:hypothetical protein
MIVGSTQVASDPTSAWEILTAFGTIGASLAALFAAATALRIAKIDRKVREAERERLENREAQAQADMVLVRFDGIQRGGSEDPDAPHLATAVVQNQSESPILDLKYEIWAQPVTERNPTDVKDVKILLPGDKTPQLTTNFWHWRRQHPLYAQRVRWRDRYGVHWVINQRDQYPTRFTGQDPAPLNPQSHFQGLRFRLRST